MELYNMKTAVEWLEKEIEGLDTAMSFHYFKDKINQAKEMEKQQQGYSEEEVLNIINQVERFINKDKSTFTEIPNWFIEQFKKTNKI
jgi:hypothetical protein